MQTKLKNLITGASISRNFKQADRFLEAEIQKEDVVFLYANRGEYWFHEKSDKSKRFSLNEDQAGEQKEFLKPQMTVEAQRYKESVVRIVLPIKMEYIVKEAPPAIRGNTADGGSKTVTLETGAQVQTPLFIEEGDIVRVNTEKGEYVERVSKK